MTAYAPCTQLEPDPQYPLNTNIHVLLQEQWIGPLDPWSWASGPWPWIYKYSLWVCCYKNLCSKWRWAARSCSPVTPSYNIHMLSQEHSFFEEHVHHVPMEWTTWCWSPWILERTQVCRTQAWPTCMCQIIQDWGNAITNPQSQILGMGWDEDGLWYLST